VKVGAVSRLTLIPLLCIAITLVAGCDDSSDTEPDPTPTVPPLPAATPTATATPETAPTSTPEPTATPVPTPPVSPSPTPTPEPTPTQGVSDNDEPVAWYIDSIADREFDGCCIERVRLHEESNTHTSWVIEYQGDGLRLSGLMAVPSGEGPFPVAIFNHGYFPFDEYQTGYDTLREVRYMAQAGYIAIAPDYRNYGESDAGDHIFEPGYVYDVMNLIEAIKDLDEADSDRMGLSGHSMGGGITLQAIVAGADVQAAVLYGTVTAFEDERYEARISRWGSGEVENSPAHQFAERYGTPDEAPEVYARMSAGNYLDRVEVPVLIHHGDADPTTPIEWAHEIEEGLRAADKDVEMHVYSGAGHSFEGYYFDMMMGRTLEFFDQYVRGSGTGAQS
jgi:uncharacterized protein